MSFAPPGYENSALVGFDFCWLAVDRQGHVAWLVTFGSAVVPPWVDADPRAFEDVEDMLTELPERGDCLPAEGKASDEEWHAAARSGVFAYDWHVYRGPYQGIAFPTAPAHVDDLPEPMARLAKRTVFEHLSFADRRELHVADVQACVRGPDSSAGT